MFWALPPHPRFILMSYKETRKTHTYYINPNTLQLKKTIMSTHHYGMTREHTKGAIRVYTVLYSGPTVDDSFLAPYIFYIICYIFILLTSRVGTGDTSSANIRQ